MTRMLVAFATKGGTTQTIAERIGARLTEAGHQVTVVAVQDNPDPAAYEAVVVGSGVLNGSVYPAGGEWVIARQGHLLGRPVGVFAVCLSALSEDPEARAAALAYPDQLAAVLPEPPFASIVFPGTYDPGSRTWWERIVARLNNAPKGDFRDWDKVDAWARELADRLAVQR
ncbi:menaquinone-dependent protoporphyrinogen oxidase [Raineyella antarctica]|uniref:Menaquinone-dependent protoporphyrinogen oxidase n=1 Tax=Raineyella antarctica TaxID=1577474 RepID=A0A1G6GCX8_9ACTN|nr:flavodoxin domain-containing protein [Raineyella antarctica]SDB79848.1 menaquinone-dependent protoporphyrinogen oxidase [Raineyella antarctica]